MWKDGDYPLLGKVLSEAGVEPMSLYTNIEKLDDIVDEVAALLESNDSTGWIEDTSWIQLENLTEAVDIPAAYQPVLGFSSVTLEHVLKAQFPEAQGGTWHVGFTSSDTLQTVLVYEKMYFEQAWETSLFYAYANLVDSTIDIRGIFYKETDEAAWVYRIESVSESDFAYRMSWHHHDAALSLLGCILGGGDKDDEFALRYREYNPADSAAYRAEAESEQVFTAAYDEGSTLASAYDEYLDETLFYTYDDVPLALLVSPFGQ
jgi:hypothetical protein